MKLRLKEFERTMRRRVRQELHNSPSAWREFRRVRRPWWRREVNLPPWTGRLLPGLAIIFCWVNMGPTQNGLIILILFASLASIAWRAGQLLVALRSSPRLLLYAHLPISDGQVFDLQWRFFLKASAWSVLDFTFLYGVLAAGVGYGWNTPLAGLAMAVVQWLVIVSAATAALAYLPNRWFLWAAIVLVVLPVALFIVPSGTALTKSVAGLASWVPPVGWVLYAMGVSPPRNVLIQWWPALSFAVLLFLLPRAYQRLRKTAVVPERALIKEAKQGAVEAWRRAESDGSNPEAFSGITAAIRRREFLEGFNWRRAGWVERFVSSWLTPRERVEAEFLTGGEPRLTKKLAVLALSWAAAALLLDFQLQMAAGVGPIGFLLLVLLFTGGLYRTGWPATALRNVSGNNIPIYAAYPVGFRQIASIGIKTNLARLAILTPLAAATALVAVKSGTFTLGVTGLFSVKAIVIIGSLTLLTPIMLVSGGTNDGSRWRVVALMLLWVPIFLVAVVVVLFAPDWGRLLLGSGLLVGVCLAGAALYGRAYDRGWFDLQSKPKETLNIKPQ